MPNYPYNIKKQVIVMENKNNINDDDYVYDNGFHPNEVKLKKDYKLYREDLFYKIINKFVVILLVIGYFFPKYLVWGFKTIGRKNKKYLKGAVVVSNHSHQLDATFTLQANLSKRFYITSLESNLGFGWISKVFRGAGVVPIPTDKDLLKRFYKETPEMIKKGNNIIIYPEASLIPYCDHIRDFKQGAFRIAIAANAPIVPIVYTFHKPYGIYKLTRGNKPLIHQNILDPYYVKDMGNKKLTIETASNELHEIIKSYFNLHSDFYK